MLRDDARHAAREYRRKRDPRRTPEPFGGDAGRRPRLRRAAARRPASPLRPAARAGRRARELGGAEGHSARAWRAASRRARRGSPARVRDFEGEIPAGQYGAGTVEIWDSGTYELVEEKRDGGLTVRLHGARLDGVWTLVPAALDGDAKNWLLLRKDDAGADAARPTRRCSRRRRRAPGRRRLGCSSRSGTASGRSRRIGGGEATFRSRNGNDLTGALRRRRARASARRVRSPSAVLDGEVCALDETGRSELRRCCSGARARSSSSSFDLLELDGEPLVDRPLAERREALAALVDRAVGGVLRLARRSTTARRSSRLRASRGSRASSRSASTRATSPAAARATGAR